MAAEPARDLQYLLDRQAILDCVYQYSRGLDRHDVDILSDAYHPDAVDHHGRFVGYIPEFVQWGNALHEADFLAHTHNITTHNCEIDGDEAHTESYVIFVLRRKDERTVLVGGGRYLDRLEKRDGDWRIALRRLIVDWRFQADGTAWGTVPRYEEGRWDREDRAYQRPLQLRPEDEAKLAAKAKPPGA